MKRSAVISRFLIRKVVTAVCITASLAAFATLGDGGKDGGNKIHQKSLLSTHKYSLNSKTFSLRSRYNYRGNAILTPAPTTKFVMMNTVVTFERGNTTYILPLKKKILLDKITFNPAH